MPVLRFFLKAAHIAIRIARVSCTWSSLRPGTEEALGTARMNDRGRDVGPAQPREPAPPFSSSVPSLWASAHGASLPRSVEWEAWCLPLGLSQRWHEEACRALGAQEVNKRPFSALPFANAPSAISTHFWPEKKLLGIWLYLKRSLPNEFLTE